MFSNKYYSNKYYCLLGKEKRKKKKVLPLQTSSSNYYNYNFLNFGIFEELNFWKFMTLEGAKLFDLLGLGLGESSVLGFFFSFEII